MKSKLVDINISKDNSKFEIKISESGKFVFVRVKIDLTMELAKEIAGKAYKIAGKHNIKRMLFDIRGVRNIDPVTKNFKFVYHFLPDPEKNRFKKIANLLTPHDNSHNFATTFLISRGYNIKEFWDENDAIAYLEKD